MIDDLKKEREKYLQRQEKQEEEKIFNAIHQQAYWNKVEADRKRILNNLDKQDKKSKIKECIHRELEIALLLIISAPLFVMLMFVACK
jgi:hypothetical protein